MSFGNFHWNSSWIFLLNSPRSTPAIPMNNSFGNVFSNRCDNASKISLQLELSFIFLIISSVTTFKIFLVNILEFFFFFEKFFNNFFGNSFSTHSATLLNIFFEIYLVTSSEITIVIPLRSPSAHPLGISFALTLENRSLFLLENPQAILLGIASEVSSAHPLRGPLKKSLRFVPSFSFEFTQINSLKWFSVIHSEISLVILTGISLILFSANFQAVFRFFYFFLWQFQREILGNWIGNYIFKFLRLLRKYLHQFQLRISEFPEKLSEKLKREWPKDFTKNIIKKSWKEFLT